MTDLLCLVMSQNPACHMIGPTGTVQLSIIYVGQRLWLSEITVAPLFSCFGGLCFFFLCMILISDSTQRHRLRITQSYIVLVLHSLRIVPFVLSRQSANNNLEKETLFEGFDRE